MLRYVFVCTNFLRNPKKKPGHLLLNEGCIIPNSYQNNFLRDHAISPALCDLKWTDIWGFTFVHKFIIEN